MLSHWAFEFDTSALHLPHLGTDRGDAVTQRPLVTVAMAAGDAVFGVYGGLEFMVQVLGNQSFLEKIQG